MQNIPILPGMLMDVAVCYEHCPLSSSDSTFTRVGAIIFLISELLHVWNYSMEVYTESIRVPVLEVRLQSLQKQVLATNASSEAKLSMTIGCKPGRSLDIDNAVQSADRKMYEHKARIKAEKARISN